MEWAILMDKPTSASSPIFCSHAGSEGIAVLNDGLPLRVFFGINDIKSFNLNASVGCTTSQPAQASVRSKENAVVIHEWTTQTLPMAMSPRMRWLFHQVLRNYV